MTFKSISSSLFITLLILCSTLNAAEKHNVTPKNGYVPDEATATKIAIAIWEPIYGKEEIKGQSPYNTVLKNGIWEVTGSLPEGWIGGVAVIEIDKETGKINRVSHGK